jgi:hypothetical protein
VKYVNEIDSTETVGGIGERDLTALVARSKHIVEDFLLRLDLPQLVFILLAGLEVAEHLASAVGVLVTAHLLVALVFQLLQSGEQLLLSFDGGIGGAEHRLEVGRLQRLL